MIELQVDRVDLVDEGANSAAFIKLYKRKENNIMTFEEILKGLKPEHQTVVSEELTKAKAMVPDATASELAEAKEGLKGKAAKLEEANESAKEKADELASVKKSLKEYQEQVAKSKEPSFEDVCKGITDPKMLEFVTTMKAKQDAAEQLAKDAAAKMENDNAIAKAKELKSLPIEEAKLAAVLKGMSPEVLDILKAANAAIEGGELFSEVGKGKGGSDTDAWAKIEKMALTVATEQKVTKAKAIGIVVKENPKLYEDYLKGGAN